MTEIVGMEGGVGGRGAGQGKTGVTTTRGHGVPAERGVLGK